MTVHQRSRAIGVVAAGLVVLLAGCGGSASPRAASRPGAVVLLAALDTTAAAKTARFDLQTTVSAGSTVSLDASGVIDFATHDAAMKAHSQIAGQNVSLELRQVGGTLYENLDGNWTSKPATKSGSTSSDPTQYLDELRGVTDDVHETGTGSSHGDRTTEYAATLDLEKASERLAGDSAARGKVESVIAALGKSTIPVRVAVDEHGRLRKMTLSFDVNGAGLPAGAHSDLTEELYDFGVPVNITVPADAHAG